MDKLEIKSKWLKSIIVKIIGNSIKKNTGCQVGIQVDDIYAENCDGKMRVKLKEVDLEMSNGEFMKLLAKMGL